MRGAALSRRDRVGGADRDRQRVGGVVGLGQLFIESTSWTMRWTWSLGARP